MGLELYPMDLIAWKSGSRQTFFLLQGVLPELEVDSGFEPPQPHMPKGTRAIGSGTLRAPVGLEIISETVGGHPLRAARDTVSGPFQIPLENRVRESGGILGFPRGESTGSDLFQIWMEWNGRR